ncbi:MAG: ATP-binding cassette domain-containing protein, partial [Betaproteobacteria bacterium]
MTIAPLVLDSIERRASARVIVDGVSKVFGAGPDAIQALQPMSLAINGGDFVCIVGPSGCGKSTLLNIVAGFETPTAGTVTLDGRAISAPGPERGVVFQQGALFNWMTVEENVAFGPRALGKPAAVALETARRYIELVGLT